MVSVTVRQAELPRITQAIATIPEVVQAYGMSGQVDLLVRVAARDTQHLFDVDARILAIDGVERTETSLVMGEVIGYRIRPLRSRHGRTRFADRAGEGSGAGGSMASAGRAASGAAPASIRTSTTPASSTAPPTIWTAEGASPSRSQAKPSAKSTSLRPMNEASRAPTRGTAITPKA
jgi:hypothetical protein